MDQAPPNPFLRSPTHGEHKIGLATACLHISAVLYLLVGLLMFAVLSENQSSDIGVAFAVAMFGFCVALIVGIEFVVAGLRRRKFWVLGRGALHFWRLSSFLVLPPGVLGLWGLLDAGSRAEFGMDDGRNR